MENATRAEKIEVIESRSIDYIPPEERRGSARDLFGIWFVPNVAASQVVLGAVIATLGMSLSWSILSIVVGVLAGTLFMAFHSAQGPAMGVPQMVQTRAQFGFLGSLLPLILAIAVEYGWYVIVAVLWGQALASLVGMSVAAGIILGSVVTLAITIFGHDILQRYSTIISLISVVLFLCIAVKVFFINDTPTVVEAYNTFGMFLLAVAIVCSGPMTWAPFVADYSRYLPESTSARASFWYTYVGCAGGAILAQSLGAVLLIQLPGADPITALGDVFGDNWSWLVLIIIILGLIQGNVLDLYSASLSTVTAVDCLSRLKTRAAGRTLRWTVATIGCIAATVFAVIASRGDFLITYENYLLVILYLIIPWTAINLVDYYVIRHGNYVIEQLFEKNGIYGSVNWPVIWIYVLGVLVQLPFINTTEFVGWFVDDLGGADIAWILGLIVPGAVYYFFARSSIRSGSGQMQDSAA